MTLTQAIKSFPGLSGVSDSFIEKVLIDRSLSGAVNYTLSLKPAAELCVADVYSFAVSSPDFSEGSLSEKIPRGVLIAKAAELYRANGEPEKAAKLTPNVKDGSRSW